MPYCFRKLTGKDVTVLRENRLGTMLSAVLFNNAPEVYKLVPTIFSLDLWRQGASERTFRVMNRLGITLSAIQTRQAVDDIAKDYDAFVKAWKQRVEKVYKNISYYSCYNKDAVN
jgi:hypothetical protein